MKAQAASSPRVVALAIAAVAALAACGKAPPAAVPAAEKLPDLATSVVAPERVPLELLWDGVVEAVNQATLSAQTSGRVVELPYDVDDYVPAGAVVVRFTDVEQQSGRKRAEALVASAEAASKSAEADYARLSEIYARKLIAKADLDKATERRDASRAALDSARAAVREAGQAVDYTVIRAPYSGIVTQRHVQVGESVRPGQPLISGISLGQLRVNVNVPQSDIEAIRQHRQAAVILDAATDKRVAAKAVVLFPYADPQTHSFKVRLELPEQETGLNPGMTVKTAFVIGDAERLLVPVAALVQRSEVSGLYVVGPNNAVTLLQVRLGHRFGDRIEVLSGLVAGARIANDPVAASLAVAASRGGSNRG
ncbi:MAG TPA: efflux RND transporter periplasmic adaptor subunit [Rhodanobacteraceae bacterium]|nr:efflux RND transporter periplasmic adaptor subunit [Rhodanobacteraceae bacterium]